MWAAYLVRFLLALKQQDRPLPVQVPYVALAVKLLTSQLDCDIFFTEHSMTSFLFVLQLQLEVICALFAILSLLVFP